MKWGSSNKMSRKPASKKIQIALSSVLPLRSTSAPGVMVMIVPGLTFVRKTHVEELRAALNETRSAVGRAPLYYTDPEMTASETLIRAAHWIELRAGLRTSLP